MQNLKELGEQHDQLRIYRQRIDDQTKECVASILAEVAKLPEGIRYSEAIAAAKLHAAEFTQALHGADKRWPPSDEVKKLAEGLKSQNQAELAAPAAALHARLEQEGLRAALITEVMSQFFTFNCMQKQALGR